MSKSIGEALFDEAQRRIMSRFELKDWQLEGPEPSDEIACVEPTRKMGIEISEFRINIYHGDDQRNVVWIELHNGELVVHAYDDAHDEPVTLHISSTGIEVDTSDH